jgi:endonuclease IV
MREVRIAHDERDREHRNSKEALRLQAERKMEALAKKLEKMEKEKKKKEKKEKKEKAMVH